ncbi:MAG TPA: hypothetical protein VFU21_08810, partial [Kofleriaceae bacterium]|nr:hypothetical protein [Kofleriaceae bacterium]
TGGGGTLRILEPAGGTEVAALQVGGVVGGLRFSRDGRRMVVLPQQGGGQPSLWDLEGRARVGDLGGHATAPFDGRFDQAGERFVTAAGDGIVRIYDARTGAALGVLTGSPQFVLSAAFDPSGAVVAATGGDGAVRFWDSEAGDLLWALDAHRVPGADVRFASDERLVTRDWEGALHVWRLDRRAIDVGELDRLLPCRSPVRFDHSRQTLVEATRPAWCP